MDRYRFQLIATVLLAIGLGAGSAAARNVKLLLPIDPVMRSKVTRTLLATDIPMHFGKASATAMDISSVATVEGVAGTRATTTQALRSDEAICQDAFRQALTALQTRARQAGAVAVAGIVSSYRGTEMDSPTAYECHLGLSRGVVELTGQFARSLAPARSVAMAPPVPSPPASSDAPSSVPPQPARIASGFAAIDDVDAVPYLDDRGRQGYRDWLTKSTPRAFAIASSGRWHSTWGLKPKNDSLPTDPSARALLMCERAAAMPCKLYAVNGAVVWVKEAK